MSDYARELGRLAQLLIDWGKFELGDKAPARLDHLEEGALCAAAANELMELRAALDHVRSRCVPAAEILNAYFAETKN